MGNYKIFTDSCSDLNEDLRREHDIGYVRMGLVVDGVEKYADLDWKDYSLEEFYGWLKEGKKVKTTQVSFEEFKLKFEPVFQEGKDVIYIACSSALSGSLNVARMVYEDEFKEKYPDRKLIVIDTLTSSPNEGILVLDAAKKRDEGLSLEELAEWVENNKFKYNQFATVETLTFLKNAGRIKGSKAFLGNLFHKKPVFISDRKGNNLTIGTVSGTKNADNALIKGILDTYVKGETKYIVVAHALAEERATRIKEQLESSTGLPVYLWWIGPIIGTTCGPGVVATFCYGKEVTRFEGDDVKGDMVY